MICLAAGEFTKVVRQWPEMMPPYSAPMMRDPELDKEAERLRLRLYGEDTSKNNLASEDAIGKQKKKHLSLSLSHGFLYVSESPCPSFSNTDAITLGDERVPVQTVIEVDAETQEKVHPVSKSICLFCFVCSQSSPPIYVSPPPPLIFLRSYVCAMYAVCLFSRQEGYGVDWEVMKEMTGYDLLVRPCGYQLIAELAQRQANGFDVALAGNNRGSILLGKRDPREAPMR